MSISSPFQAHSKLRDSERVGEKKTDREFTLIICRYKREFGHVPRKPNHIHKPEKLIPGADCIHIKDSGTKQYHLFKMPGTEA